MKTNLKFSNKLFVAALMMLMAICLSCIVGFTYVMASAATGDTIGLGEENKVTVEVTPTTPATFMVSEKVPAGSYLFTAFAMELPEDERWNVTFNLQSTDEEYFITYNPYVEGYTSVVSVKPGMELTLSLYGSYNVEVEAYLDNLYIGPANEYWLSGIQIMAGQSSTITLKDVPAGNYIASAEIIDGALEKGATMSIQVDEGTVLPMTYNVNMYGAYTANIAIDENSKTLTLATTSEIELTINFNLYAETETTPLPTTTADYFTAFEARTYSYKATSTGYQSIVPTAYPSADDFYITFKTTANDFSGESVQGDNYPLYMESGKTYYFTVMYFGFDNGANIKFDVTAWEAPTLYVHSEIVYAPVSNSNVIGAINYEVSEAGTYELALINVAYWEAQITVHYGDNKTEVLNGGNSFTVNVDLGTTGEMYFTTTYDVSFAVGVALGNSAREYDDEIALDTNVEIELNAGESLVYVVGRMNDGEFEGLTNGNYAVTLTGANGQVVIYDANYYTPVVAYGESSGMFAVLLDYPNEWGYNGETSRQQPLLIENYGDTTVTFTIRVTAYAGNMLTLGTATQITLAADANTTYFLEGLDSGSYVVMVGGTHSNIVVYNMAERYTALVPMGAEEGMYSFTLVPARHDPEFPETDYDGETSRTLGLLIQNVGYTSETFTITVVKVNSLELDTATEIALTANQGATYYIGNLVSGTYNVAIENGEGVTVVAKGATYSNGKLVVKASEGKYALVALTFSSTTSKTITVTVTETVDGTMNVGEAQKVELSYNDDTVSYEIYLTAGNYEINLTDVEWTGFFEAYYMVAVNDNYIIFGDTYAYFEIFEDGYYVVTFMYYDDYTVSFNATITEVASEDNTLMLGEYKDITLSAGETKTYYIDLPAGSYAVMLSDGTQITVTADGEIIIYNEEVGLFDVELVAGQTNKTVEIVFTNNSSAEVTITAVVFDLADLD